MEIDINQQKISIGDKYKIYTNGNLTHRASAKLFRLFAEIDLFSIEGEKPIITIKKQFFLFKPRYYLTQVGADVVEFYTVSFWKAHYQCKIGRDVYDIYRHRGRKCSVFRNDQQIAWWDKEAVSWFNGDNYKIIANDDAPHILLMAFCLILDNYANSDKEKKGTVNFDIGRIGFEARKFNTQWRPNATTNR